MAIIQMKFKAEFDELVKSRSAVAIHAHAEWSGASMFMSQKLDMYAQDDTNKLVAFARFIIEDVRDVVDDLGIRSLPTFFFYKNDEVLKTLTGPSTSGVEEAVRRLSST